jgi:hypothetical protein
VLERTPALFTLIYVGGFGFVILLLLVGLIRSRRQVGPPVPEDLPKEVRKRLGSTSTNRGLRALRWLFILLAFGMFGFHIYWAHYAQEQNEKFQQLSYKDLRGRRLSESTLRGWVFDRSGRVDQPLAYYKRDSGGHIRREYPMDRALGHLFGSDRGDPGLERALFGVQSGVLPEALEVVKGQEVEFKEKPRPVPAELKQVFAKNPAVKKAFDALTPGRRRAYIFHFSGAKQPATRQSRIEKCIPAILKGKGLTDR